MQSTQVHFAICQVTIQMGKKTTHRNEIPWHQQAGYIYNSYQLKYSCY